MDSALAQIAMACPQNKAQKYILTPDVTMQLGRALLFIAEASRRVKIEPEDETPVSVRRVGFIPGTTDLAFGEFVPYLSSTEGVQLRRESMPEISTASLAPSVTMATQTDADRT